MIRIFIVLSFLLCGVAGAKGRTRRSRLLKALSHKLIELDEQFRDGKQELREKVQQLSNGQKQLLDGQKQLLDGQKQLGDGRQEIQKKIESAENQTTDSWHLGMNINPADGHIFGYTVGWATGEDIGSVENALTKDYLSADVWVLPASYIAIVRHQHGVIDAVKVFKFNKPHESLSIRFGLKKMNPGRQVVTSGGPIQESIADDAENLEDDPIFSVGGDLAFNWAYYNNGCRIALTGGHLSTANSDDDNTNGLGNDFFCDPLRNKHGRYGLAFAHDISNIQHCDNTAGCQNVIVQGSDHGTGSSLKSGPVYGNYAIYVSESANKFPEPGYKLGLEIDL